MPAEKLIDAKTIICNYLDSDITEEQKTAAEKVLRVIQTAIDNNTYVVFEF